MTMKGRLTALSLLALASSPVYGLEKGQRVDPDTEDEKLTKKKLHQEVLQSKGLKYFNIDGVWVLALNKKNAERKAKKITV